MEDYQNNQQYQSPAYQSPAYAQSSPMDLGAWSPTALLWNQAVCMAIGIVIFMVVTWLISKIPIIGPWTSRTIKWIITKLAVMAGVLNCGFKDEEYYYLG